MIDVLIIFAVAIPVVLLFHRMKLPPMVGFLVTGTLIGPTGIGLIKDAEQIQRLAEIGVTLILFSAGLEFSFKNLKSIKRYGLYGGVLQVVATIGAGLLMGILMGWPPRLGLFFGCLMALSSTAIVLIGLYQYRMTDSLQGQIATAILIVQDLAVIPMLVFIPAFVTGEDLQSLWPLVGSKLLLATLIILAVAFVICYVANPFFERIAQSRSRELFLITVITLAVGMAWFTNRYGLSMALGAFLAGIIVGGTRFQLQALSEISPFRYCFNSLFFTSIGMLISVDVFRESWGLILLLVVLIPLLKGFITSAVLTVLGLPLRLALTIAICLGQIGEFSFLLAYFGNNLGVIDHSFYQLIIVVAALLMMITPFMLAHSNRMANTLSMLPLLRRWSQTKDELLLEDKVQEYSDHVVICGFGPIGEILGRILSHHRIPFVVLELNPKTVERLTDLGQDAFYGDGASEEILYHCGLERARLLAITTPDYMNSAAIIQQARVLNPNVQIMTRAKYRQQIDDLYAAGANVVVSEEDEVGSALSVHALAMLGIPQRGGLSV